MMESKNKLIRFSEAKDRDFFPSTFSNEIYLSNVKNFNVFQYVSNFSIKYVLEGNESYKVGNTDFFIKKGQYLLVNNGQEIETRESSGKAMSIFLDLDILSDCYKNLIYSENKLLDSLGESPKTDLFLFENIYSHHDSLGRFLNHLYHIFLNGSPFLKGDIFFLITEQLLLNQVEIRRQINRLKKQRSSTRSELFRRIQLAKTYIHDTLSQDFHLDQLAKEACLSKYHLIRSFKELYQLTPYQYFMTQKIEHSLNLLADPKHSISEVAQRSGFNDIFHYSKRFKAIKGFSPQTYRNEFKSGYQSKNY